jgi:alkylated DNA repair dioxygenase AlkB
VNGLFAAGATLSPLALPDGELYFLEALPLAEPVDHVMARLVAETPWRSETITLWGQPHLQPRLTAWYGDPDAHYTYSGMSLAPQPWTPLLADIRARVEQTTRRTFNSVLLNYYRDGRDSMGMHSDDEPELGRDPAVAALSLGAPRVFTLKHKTDKTVAPVRIALGEGSLLLMAGATQHNWRHGIARTARPVGPRISLTFRLIRPS